LPLLANLEKRSTYRELDCFLGAGNNILEENALADEAARDVFALFWETIVLTAEKALSCF